MLKNLEGLAADHPMREFINPLYHLSDQSHETNSNQHMYGNHHDPSLNISDNFHPANPNSNYGYNMAPNHLNPRFNIQDLVAGNKNLYDMLPGMGHPIVPAEATEHKSEKEEDVEKNEEDDDDSKSDGSDAKKRGKYKTYTDEEKNQIINMVAKHGIEKTLDLFSEGEHKLTKRKLRSWLESQDKVKGVKGRKSNEPNRDGFLYEWYLNFQNEHNRPPTRKEATKRALEITDDPKFQASKGWLDKFSRKFKVEFTPLKIVPPKALKKFKSNLLEDDIVSTATTNLGSGLLGEGSGSPTSNKKLKTEHLVAKKINSAPVQDKEKASKIEVKEPSTAVNPLLQNLSGHKMSQIQPEFKPPSFMNSAGSLTSTDKNTQFINNKAPLENPALDANKPPGQGYPMPFYPMDYSVYRPFNYQNMYSSMPNYPMNYPMGMPMNYPPNFAENFQRLQQVMKKDNEVNPEKPN